MARLVPTMGSFLPEKADSPLESAETTQEAHNRSVLLSWRMATRLVTAVPSLPSSYHLVSRSVTLKHL